jgi:hypothetical protein
MARLDQAQARGDELRGRLANPDITPAGQLLILAAMREQSAEIEAVRKIIIAADATLWAAEFDRIEASILAVMGGV